MHVHIISGDGEAKFWLEPVVHSPGTIITIEDNLKK